MRGETGFGIKTFQRIPLEFYPDKSPLRTAARFRDERQPADEMFLGKIYCPGEIELEGR